MKVLVSLNFPGIAKINSPTPPPTEKKWEYHLVIIGFGINGRLLAKTAKETAIPYLIIEMNAETVKEEIKKGEPIIYGDATHESLLKHAYVKNAFVVVIAIPDIIATRRIVEMVRKLNSKGHIIVRTRFILEVKPLSLLGADIVVPFEFEAALEIQKQMLTHFLIPPDEIERFVKKVRADGYRKYITEKSEYYNQNAIDEMF